MNGEFERVYNYLDDLINSYQESLQRLSDKIDCLQVVKGTVETFIKERKDDD